MLNEADSMYTPFYCEENVWQLARRTDHASVERFVVFISNARRQCALWHQRAALHPSAPVIWDYHVVLLARADVWQIWDLDTTEPSPCPASHWLAATFPSEPPIDAALLPTFKLVDAHRYVEEFSSSRRHMLDAHGRFRAPPPSWPLIGSGRADNLAEYIDMTSPSRGEIVSLAEFRARFATTTIAS